MKLAVYPAVLLLAALVWGPAALVARESSAHEEAIAGAVSGGRIQKVGFRAMIQKQAIMYNLAGYARNNSDGTVGLSLQGDKHRIDKVLEAIRAGTKRSSPDNKVNASPAPVDPRLNTFTVFGWMSAVWSSIAESTLKGDDLTKFKNHLGAED